MAQITGTSDSYRVGAAGGNREDLEDTIWDLFPDETYCLTNFDKVDANGTYHEWMLDGIVAHAVDLVRGTDTSHPVAEG